MRLVRSMAAAGALAAGLASAWAGDVYVVAHPGVNLTADEVREVFLGDKQFAGPVKLTPIDNASLQAEFQSKVLQVDANRYASIWSKKGFRDGLTPPPVRASDQDVINAVRSNPGALGYVSKAPPDVKVIQKY